jgi:sRNA-binding regulator protein Hfq
VCRFICLAVYVHVYIYTYRGPKVTVMVSICLVQGVALQGVVASLE